MTLYEAIRTVLAASAPLTELVGDRIRPDKMDEGDDVPFVLIKCSATPEDTLDGDIGIGEAKVTLYVWSVSRTQTDEVMKLAATALLGADVVGDLALDAWNDESDSDVDPANDNSDENDWYTTQRSFAVLYQPAEG